jgi:hypothetical protein
MKMDRSRKVTTAGRGSRYAAPQNDYGSATMPMAAPARMGNGGRAYPSDRIPCCTQGISEGKAAGKAKGDHSSSVSSRGRPTPTAGNALPMSGGTSSRVRQESSRRGRGMK